MQITEEDLRWWAKCAHHNQKFKDALTRYESVRRRNPSSKVEITWEKSGLFRIKTSSEIKARRKRRRLRGRKRISNS